MPPEPDNLDLDMMRLALRWAKKAADRQEVPVGAVVYGSDGPVAHGYNLREARQDPTAHAEMIALVRAAKKTGSWRLTGLRLAVTLEPCPMCAGALVNARIAKLVYGASDPKMGCVDTLHRLCDDPRMNHRVQIVSGVLAEESADLLRGFFRTRRQKA